MGAGKSKVAEELAARMHWKAFDMDKIIVDQEQRSISEIFAANGEPYFREIESRVLLDLLAHRNAVIATGGGAFAQEANRIRMLESTMVVWLDVPLEVIIERLRGDENRPLARDPAKMKALWEERRPMCELAHVHVNGSHAPHVVADNVLQCVRWY